MTDQEKMLMSDIMSYVIQLNAEKKNAVFYYIQGLMAGGCNG